MTAEERVLLLLFERIMYLLAIVAFESGCEGSLRVIVVYLAAGRVDVKWNLAFEPLNGWRLRGGFIFVGVGLWSIYIRFRSLVLLGFLKSSFRACTLNAGPILMIFCFHVLVFQVLNATQTSIYLFLWTLPKTWGNKCVVPVLYFRVNLREFYMKVRVGNVLKKSSRKFCMSDVYWR